VELAVQVKVTLALPAVACRLDGAAGVGATGRALTTLELTLSGAPPEPMAASLNS